jgi:penicillin-binding protein-related factor A (putative recombinase)
MTTPPRRLAQPRRPSPWGGVPDVLGGDEASAPPAPTKRQNAGRLAQAQGAAFEDFLDHLHALMAREVFVYRCHPEVTIVKGSAKLTGIGPPDYGGIVDGVAVLFDAKTCSQARWALSEVAHHQGAMLTAMDRAGGFAFIALMDSEARRWVLPWASLRRQWELAMVGGPAAPGAKSLSHDDLQRLGVPFDKGGSWLPAVRRLIAQREASP